MRKISSLIKVLKSKSPKYILFRSKYEIERRSGLLAGKFPTSPKSVKLPTLSEWRDSSVQYLFNNRESLKVPKVTSDKLKGEAERVLRGEVQLFSCEWYSIGLNPDWVTNPSNGYRYDANKHWTKVADLDKEAGDIKFTWEPSRFSFLYTIVKYDYAFDEDHSDWVIGRILDWIDKNPLNCGPNYKCSQEISLRVLNWLFALNFYRDSKALTGEVWQKVIRSIYWQIHHVRKNINFSRISVRNNHAITETLTLYLIGLLFPSFPGASEWKRKGKKWFEQEIEYQFEPDGTYLQNSMNYQRVVTQLLTLAIALADRNGETFSKVVYDRAYANLNFLYQCMDDKTGMLPNYGSNDGALFFQCHNQDYCDYRPQIQDLEDLLVKKGYPKLEKKQGLVVFDKGGYFLFREDNTLTFIRCGGFKGGYPPDQLHIDIWKDGENLLMDGGTFKYNTEDRLVKYFAGTESHNTVMLNDSDQKLKGPRFMWFYPLTVEEAAVKENEEAYMFEGKIWAFKNLAPDIHLTRNIVKFKNKDCWEITDSISGETDDLVMRQLWHTCADSVKFESDATQSSSIGHYSRYYGSMKDSCQIEFHTKENKITTKLYIK